MKFVLATGFQKFWRGISQKERMLVRILGQLRKPLISFDDEIGNYFLEKAYLIEMTRYAIFHVN